MAVLANILPMKAHQDEGQNACREPVDNSDQIGKVLALRPYGYLCGRQKFRRRMWSRRKTGVGGARNALSSRFEGAIALHRARFDTGAFAADLHPPASRP